MSLMIATATAPSMARPPKWEQITDADRAVLPPACQVRLTKGEAARPAKLEWSKRLGNEYFLHLHHYCFGLIYLNKARLTFDRETRNEIVKRSVGEFQYAINRWPDNSPLKKDAQNLQNQARALQMP